MRLSRIFAFIKKHPLAIFTIFLVMIKLMMIINLPIYAITNAGFDDALMIKNAEDILNFGWLGAYDSNTFVKGIGFPMFLAFSNKLGMSYTFSVTLYYIVACVLLVYVIRSLFKNKLWLYLIITILIFNPIISSHLVMQRVYRNGITLGQALFIISSIIYLFKNKDGNMFKMTVFGILGGLNLGFLYNSREDGIWIMPFVIFASIVIVVSLYKKYKFGKLFVTRSFVVLLPIILLFSMNMMISFINYQKYGVFLTTELSGGSFPKAMKSIYAVSQNESLEKDRVAVPYETFERIYKVSPTMKRLEPYLKTSYLAWDVNDTNNTDGDVESGWLFWCLRDAVSQSGGYKNALEAENIYGNIHMEIESAFETKKLEKRATMPSALMAPWKSGYTPKVLKNALLSAIFVSSFEDSDSQMMESIENGGKSIKAFEDMTNNQAIAPNWTFVSGWLTFKNGDYNVLVLDESKQMIKKLGYEDSPDIADAYPGYINNNQSRFTYNEQGLKAKYLKIIDAELKTEKLIPIGNKTSIETDFYKFHLDESIVRNTVSYSLMKQATHRLNIVSNTYQIFSPIFSLFGLFGYAFISYSAFKSRGKQNNQYWTLWLVTTGILGSLITLIFGVAYNETVSCSSIKALYLSAAYPLLLAFSSICTFYVLDCLIFNYKQKKGIST